MKFDKEGTCSICGGRYENFGNNPQPLLPHFHQRCCDKCNWDKVVQARLLALIPKHDLEVLEAGIRAALKTKKPRKTN